jgi:hypothetical protein
MCPENAMPMWYALRHQSVSLYPENQRRAVCKEKEVDWCVKDSHGSERDRRPGELISN